jgi:hypothetical protein
MLQIRTNYESRIQPVAYVQVIRDPSGNCVTSPRERKQMGRNVAQSVHAWRRRPGNRWLNLLVDGFVAAGIVAVIGLLAWTVLAAIGSNATAGRHNESLSGDFLANFAAGRMVLEGNASDLYDEESISQARDRALGMQTNETNPYLLPPVAAVFFAAFALLPFPTAALTWAAFSVLLLAASIRALWSFSPQPERSVKVFRTAAMAGTWPVAMTLSGGQNGALWLAAYTFGLHHLVKGNHVVAGLVLGLGALKPQLFLGVPVLLLFQRRWQALAAWMATTSVLALVSLALVGTSGARSYLTLLTSESYQVHAVQNAWRMISIPAFLRSTLPSAAGVLSVVVAVVGLGALAYVSARGSLASAYAAAIVVSLAIAPHCFVYDAVILGVPIILMFGRIPDPMPRPILGALWALTWLAGMVTPHPGSPLAASPVAIPWTVAPVVALAIVALHDACRCGASD